MTCTAGVVHEAHKVLEVEAARRLSRATRGVVCPLGVINSARRCEPQQQEATAPTPFALLSGEARDPKFFFRFVEKKVLLTDFATVFVARGRCELLYRVTRPGTRSSLRLRRNLSVFLFPPSGSPGVEQQVCFPEAKFFLHLVTSFAVPFLFLLYEKLLKINRKFIFSPVLKNYG